MLGWSSKAIEWLNPEQPPPTTEIRSPLGAGSWELMISFTLPIAFSVISTMLFIYSWIVGKSLVPLYRRDRITPTFNHLDGALWDSVAEKSTLNSAGTEIGIRGNPGTDRTASEFPANGAGNPWQSCQSPACYRAKCIR